MTASVRSAVLLAVTYVLVLAVVNESLESSHRVPLPAVTRALDVSGTSLFHPVKLVMMDQKDLKSLLSGVLFVNRVSALVGQLRLISLRPYWKPRLPELSAHHAHLRQ